ncbi:MAG: twin-arginine translocase subunit TatC [Planctomycetes bacterium]|nr:twin-arginine translocase subunit TatC [Planctomycetota bacterium]
MPTLDDPAVRALYADERELPRMSFGDHLDELRSRLIRALLAVGAAIALVMPWKTEVQEIILHPYRVQWRLGFLDWIAQLEAKEAAGRFAGDTADRLGRDYLAFCRAHRDSILAGDFEYPQTLVQNTGYGVPYEMYALNGLDDMMAYMFAAFVFALVLAAPVVLWQVWAFVAAGLYPQERRVFYRFFPFMAGLMAAGVWFGYRIALPYSLGFLIKMMNPGQVGAMFSIGQFLNLEFALTGAMGLVFQLPLVMLALQRVGLVSHQAWRRHWRVTVLLIFIAAAVFTPPEPVSMLLMATPMLLLYGLGLVLTRLGGSAASSAAAPSAEVGR